MTNKMADKMVDKMADKTGRRMIHTVATYLLPRRVSQPQCVLGDDAVGMQWRFPDDENLVDASGDRLDVSRHVGYWNKPRYLKIRFICMRHRINVKSISVIR